jgi:arsenate reductase
MRVLFVCTGNRARSQMAEGWARHLAPPGVEVLSAGTVPNPKGVHPRAVEVMRERGVDIRGQRTKSLDELTPGFDFVITVCAEADAACPTLPARLRRLQWHLPDPDRAGVGEDEERAFFRDIRDELERRVRALFSDATFQGSLESQKAAG